MSEPDSKPTVLPSGSGPAGTPANVRQPRPRRVGDIAGSIVLLVVGLAAYFIGVVFSILMLAFSDSCTQATCNVDAAVNAQAGTAIVLALVLLAGAITTIVFAFALRRRAWPIALGTLVAIIVGWVIGAIVFFAALGS